MKFEHFLSQSNGEMNEEGTVGCKHVIAISWQHLQRLVVWRPRYLTRAAVKTSSDEMPEFFRASGGMIAHCAFDPDVSKNRGTPVVASSEHSEHYIES